MRCPHLAFAFRLSLALSAPAMLALACSSGGGGGGVLACADGGSCPPGQGGSSGHAGASGAGATGAGGSGGSSGASGSAGAGASGGEPPCAPIGFELGPTPFAVPAPRCQEAFDAPSKSSYSKIAYALVDFSADDVSDLVVHRDDCDSSVGTARWDLYPGTQAGFAAAPTPLSIPAPRCQEAFDELGKSSYSKIGYALVDLTADELPDVVVHRDDCDAAVGVQRWDVYSGAASGFSAAPKPVSIPAPRCQEAFDALTKSSYSKLGYALLELTGDDHPDLVVYRDDCDPAVGAQRWDVYAGSGAGFAAQPKPFALPAPRCQESFDEIAKSSYSKLGYALLDLTADELPDLVVHRDDCDTTIGTQRWDVYPASPAGFVAAPTAFALPAPRCEENYDALTKSSYSKLGYALVDLSADRRPDLVVHRDDCDPALGNERWDVYTASAAGFASAPSAFAIPAPRCQESYDALAKSSYSAMGFSLVSLSATGVASLAVHRDDCDSAIGQTRWDVHHATCAE